MRAKTSPPATTEGDGLVVTNTNVQPATRGRLLALLLRDGILHRSDTQPVLSGDGRSARWMLDSLAVTLTPEGADLAARALLERLDGFESRQLATYGLTGVPLLQSCIVASGGRYRGALVRKERKPHGARKLIEGRLAVDEPVVIVDDSINSGYSLLTCAHQLESAGFEVEGGVCLVRFDYAAGPALLHRSGYRVDAVYSIFEDIIGSVPGEAPYVLNPTKAPPPPARSTLCAEEGVDPVTLARAAMVEYGRSGTCLTPPATLDRDRGGGGCFVSLRDRRDVHRRLVRSGFWHFPGEARTTCAADVVLAAVDAARTLQATGRAVGEALETCAVAVTFFSALERCELADLDNDRYGIVVRSAIRAPQMGGALPRMPGIRDEWEQFRHAWRTNAALLPGEPYLLYRHDVDKVVERGARWHGSGVPSPTPAPSTATGELAIAARAAIIPAHGQRHGDATIPEDAMVFVSVYADGRLTGCVGGPISGVEGLAQYARAARDDARFAPPAAGAELVGTVSVLTNRHEIGEADPDWVVGPFRFAEQVLAVRRGDRSGLLLPFVAVTGNLTPRGYVDSVIAKAGLDAGPYVWTRFDCDTWLADDQGATRLRDGFPVGDPPSSIGEACDRLRPMLERYVRQHCEPGLRPMRRHDVFAHRVDTPLDPARCAYDAWVKQRAGLSDLAAADLAGLDASLDDDGWVRIDGHEPSVSELAFLLLCRIDSGSDAVGAIARRLTAQIDGHGRIATHPDGRGTDADQDYGPGQVLIALAPATERGLVDRDVDRIGRAFRHYRMRFRRNRSWGAMSWLLQACVAWSDLAPALDTMPFACDIVDWALAHQSAKSGAFLNDHQADGPGAVNAVYLEGLAAVAAVVPDDDVERAARYHEACRRSLQFLDRLVYQERDMAIVPNRRWVIGGLRSSVTASDVYIDHVHHALAAITTLDAESTSDR
jgi:orotate phosphoribosyltransferase/AMMECR1 domain-containing protein